MNCTQAKALFSPYLDGAVSGKQMRAVREHLGHCSECGHEYTLLTHSQRLLGMVGRNRRLPTWRCACALPFPKKLLPCAGPTLPACGCVCRTPSTP
jgi:hypothetical protein